MPVSKKQLEKLNKVKKAKAEELAKQAATGSESAKKKLKKLQKRLSKFYFCLHDAIIAMLLGLQLCFGVHLPDAKGIVLGIQTDHEVTHSRDSHLGDYDLAPSFFTFSEYSSTDGTPM